MDARRKPEVASLGENDDKEQALESCIFIINSREIESEAKAEVSNSSQSRMTKYNVK
jgi:hypothetical protein